MNPRPPHARPLQAERRSSARSQALCAAASIVFATLAQAQDWTRSEAVGLGPLLLRSQAPLSLLRYSPTPLAPITSESGQWFVGTVLNWNNYYAYEPNRFIFDIETVGVTLGASYGVTDRFDVTTTVPLSYRGGGTLDGFIEGFEKAFGVANANRRMRPRNQMLIHIIGDNGAVYDRSGADSGWGLEDANVALRYQISTGDKRKPAVLLGLGFNVPIGRPSSLRSSGGLDMAAGVAVGQRLSDRFYLFGNAALTRHSVNEIAGVALVRVQWQAFGGVEFRSTPRSSWLLQGTTISRGAEDFGGFARPSNEITLGYKHLLADDLLLEVSVLENLFVFDNSPDVGFHAGLVWRSRPSERAALARRATCSRRPRGRKRPAPARRADAGRR